MCLIGREMFHARHTSAGVASFSGTVCRYQEVCQNWHFEALMFGLDEADLWRGLGWRTLGLD